MAPPSAQDRWNIRYHALPPGPLRPRPWLVEHQALLPASGLAFDLAMGLGGSAGWLIEQGWRAAGADISEVAVRRAKARWPALLAFVADLERLVLPAAAFDLLHGDDARRRAEAFAQNGNGFFGGFHHEAVALRSGGCGGHAN